MAGSKYLRLLWEIVFPYEIRWGIEKVADKASAHDVKNLATADAPTPCRRFSSEPEKQSHGVAQSSPW
jgi:hypothetical protein